MDKEKKIAWLENQIREFESCYVNSIINRDVLDAWRNELYELKGLTKRQDDETPEQRQIRLSKLRKREAAYKAAKEAAIDKACKEIGIA